MPKSKTVRTAAVFTAAVLFTCASAAFADTTIKSSGTEARGDDNAIRIEHGCKAPGIDESPVIAQSVLFPTVSPRLTGSDGSVIADVSQVITQGSIAGLLKPIQDTSAFQTQQTKFDSLGNAIGFSSTDGSLDLDFEGRLPFQFTGPNFVAASCARRLLIKVAIADICGSSIQAGQVNLWIPSNGSQYAAMGAAAGVMGIGQPATLVINRDLSVNPLSPACGAGIDVTVTPSAADIDANLRIPGVWSSNPAAEASAPVTVVEYYNTSLNHYFVTWIPDEIGKLDAGVVLRGWVRTGRTFKTYKTAQPGSSPVCRFYIPPGLGDSHFYGRGTVECDATAQKNPSFILEDPLFMQMFLPDAGVCPANTKQIYRVFSNRVDANHRYMTDKITRDQMVSLGWLAEGDGNDMVVMCAPQ